MIAVKAADSMYSSSRTTRPSRILVTMHAGTSMR